MSIYHKYSTVYEHTPQNESPRLKDNQMFIKQIWTREGKKIQHTKDKTMLQIKHSELNKIDSKISKQRARQIWMRCLIESLGF